MERATRVTLLAFAGWTLFVWAQRVVNVLGDDSLDGGGIAFRLVLAGTFVVLGLVVGIAAIVTRSGRPTWLHLAVKALAVWTVGVWVWRMVDIATGDWSVAFVVVHLVLAVVSVTLAVLSWRAVSRPTYSQAPEMVSG